MLEKLKKKFEGYAMRVAIRKGGLILGNLLASGSAAAYLTQQAQPYFLQYGPTLAKYGLHVTPEVFFTSICGLLATLLHDAYQVSQTNAASLEQTNAEKSATQEQGGK